MKAKPKWSSTSTSCLSDRAILRARVREVNTMLSKPPISGMPVSEALSEGARSAAPQICNGCKESRPLAITGRMAQSVSHDLRNHLSAVYSNVEFMSQSRTTEVEREELLEDVHAVIQHMTDMLDSLLLFAKTGQVLRPGWVSLNEMVEHAARMVRSHPDARNVNLVIQNGASVVGWMDCTKLGSAVYNLLLNVCQAARLGLAPRRVLVTDAEDQHLVHILVIDSGRGVPASIRQTLFQPFVSAEKVNGIGVGLAIVNCIVKEHGGYVDFGGVRPEADGLWSAFVEECIRQSSSEFAAMNSSPDEMRHLPQGAYA
jgi:signal transduction histidine kinase